jgi:hypothetical protein
MYHNKYPPGGYFYTSLVLGDGAREQGSRGAEGQRRQGKIKSKI